ncbi:MAG: hypothetical protein M5U30_04315 [Burkholderiaceae bacterium]|nr:hypothetical protein [Burkholderiaceae bacterium]
MPGIVPTRWLAAIVAALCAAAFAGAALAADPAGRVVKPSISVDRSTQCIDSPEVMRRTHMDMLKHERDRTVRKGIRGEKVSLNGCIDCHAGPGAGAAAGSAAGSPQAFCETCHRYAAVKLDCFECHQARPAGAQPARAQAGAAPPARAAQAAQAFLAAPTTAPGDAAAAAPGAAGAQR